LARKTITAINGAVTSGLERNLAAPAAVSTGCIEHFTLASATAASVVLHDVAASFTARGLIVEAFFREEILLTCRKHEFLFTVSADDCFVLIQSNNLF